MLSRAQTRVYEVVDNEQNEEKGYLKVYNFKGDKVWNVAIEHDGATVKKTLSDVYVWMYGKINITLIMNHLLINWFLLLCYTTTVNVCSEIV